MYLLWKQICLVITRCVRGTGLSARILYKFHFDLGCKIEVICMNKSAFFKAVTLFLSVLGTIICIQQSTVEIRNKNIKNIITFIHGSTFSFHVSHLTTKKYRIFLPEGNNLQLI
jgi:hypothetical protein